MHHLMTALPVCALLAMQLVMTSAETCKPGLSSNQCITSPPPCGYCGEYITIDIVVTNTYTVPKFQSKITVENEPQQPLIYFLQKAARQNGVFAFSAAYSAQFGFYVNTINKVTASPAAQTYWSIISVTNNNQMIPCGVSSYIPAQNEVILFNFTTWGHTQKDAAFPQCTFDGCN